MHGIGCVSIRVILYHILGSSVSCECVPGLEFFLGGSSFCVTVRKTKGSPILPYGPSFPTVGRKKVWESLLFSGKEKNGGDQERKGTAHLQIRSLPLFFFLPPKKKKKGKIATRKKLRKSAPSFDAFFCGKRLGRLISLLCFIKRTVSRVIIVGVFYISPRFATIQYF